MKERINYIRGKSGGFSGYPVNLPVVCAEGETIEELEKNIRELVTSVLDVMKEMYSGQFEMHEVKDLETWLHGEEEARVRKELNRYKEIYGELRKDDDCQV